LTMLRHIGERTSADVIFGAVSRVLAAGTTLTRDLGGSATTTQFTDAIVREIETHKG
jgi:isocitrate dehydrogenase (NAD+)